MEITKDKITEIFCIIDDFCQEYDKEIARMSICEPPDFVTQKTCIL